MHVEFIADSDKDAERNSLEALLEQVEDVKLRDQLRKRVLSASLDDLFEGSNWINETPDPHRKTPGAVIRDIDRVVESLSHTSIAAAHLDVLIAELDRRRRNGFGLVWDAESPVRRARIDS